MEGQQTALMEKENPTASSDGAAREHPENHPDEPVWLIFLILLFMFGNPLFDTCSFLMQLRLYEKVGIVWVFPDIFSFYTGYGWFIVIFSSLVSLYTGYRLGEKREWASIQFARWMFWLIGPLQVLLLQGVYCLFFISVSGYKILGYVLLPMAKSLLWTLAWTTWLGRSRHIRELYGYTEEQDG